MPSSSVFIISGTILGLLLYSCYDFLIVFVFLSLSPGNWTSSSPSALSWGLVICCSPFEIPSFSVPAELTVSDPYAEALAMLYYVAVLFLDRFRVLDFFTDLSVFYVFNFETDSSVTGLEASRSFLRKYSRRSRIHFWILIAPVSSVSGLCIFLLIWSIKPLNLRYAL